MSMDLSEFFQMFFEESLELLDDVEKTLLSINVSDYSDDEINLIFRGMHSIKGGSSTFGFSDIGQFTHTLETYLDYVRTRSLSLTTESVDLLLKSVDCIRGMIATHQGNPQQDISMASDLRLQFEKYNESMAKPEKPAESTEHSECSIEVSISSTSVEVNHSEPESNGVIGWYIYFKPYASMIQKGNDPLRILSELSKLGFSLIIGNTDSLPYWDDIELEQAYISWDIFVQTNKSIEEIKADVFDWVLDECCLFFKEQFTIIDNKDDLLRYASAIKEERELNQSQNHDLEVQNSEDSSMSVHQEHESVDTHAEEHSHNVASSPEVKRAPAVVAKDSPSIRVSTEKVDEIINIVGELVITQAILKQVINNKESLAEDIKLKECLSQFTQNIRELQERAMVMRMLPISNVFNRFPRMVRDIAQLMGKKIELQISGENTEIDKTVMEKIGDPLVHLVRNSIDHGIEPSAVRLERNKPETGILQLHAYHQGSAIIIDIIDDGNGLNTNKIREKALEKGLIKEDQSLTDDEIHALIFLPGFSTADKVTDISGRGVGMDVVKKNIQAVGGSISVYSTPGQGSRFSIKLPLTLSIIDGQILNVSNQTFIFPISSIVEIIQIKLSQVSKVAEDNEVYFLRSKYIPMIHLTQVFELEVSSSGLEGKFLIIVEVNHSYFGIVIDELLGQQQIVIKSIEQNFEHVEGIAGATVLGDGTVALIIDVTGLAQLSAARKRSHYQESIEHKHHN